MQDHITPALQAAEPSFALRMTQDEVAAVSGFSVGRIEDLRSRTRRAKGQAGPDFFHDYDSRNQKRVFYTPEAVRAWLAVKRPSKLPELDAWLAARTSTSEV